MERRGFGSGGKAAVIWWFEEASADESDETIKMESSRDQRQEGIGAGDGVRPRGRRKALKGAIP